MHASDDAPLCMWFITEIRRAPPSALIRTISRIQHNNCAFVCVWGGRERGRMLHARAAGKVTRTHTRTQTEQTQEINTETAAEIQ
jgi:hypothetical protein